MPFEHELKNAYIGEPRSYIPTANTIAYYPLSSISTVNDKSGNSYNLTNTGGVTFGTYKGVDCAYYNKTGYLSQTLSYSGGAVTLSAWGYYIRGTSSDEGFVRFGPNFGVYVSYNSPYKILCSPGGIGTQSSSSDSGWKLYTVTYNGTNTMKLYLNAALDATNSSATVQTGSGLAVGNVNTTSGTTKYWKGGISEVIIESKERTATEISNYYNRTKADYGL